jgi:hypothetical protein
MQKNFGRPPIQLTESQVRYAMENSFGNKAAARFLNIDYRTYKKYAKMYVDNESGKTLFELHKKLGVPLDKPTKEKHWQGKSFDCNKGYKEKLEDILDGKYPGYNSKKLRKRLLLSGWIPCECASCGWNEPRMTDGNYPLLIDFIDNDWRNTTLENLRLLCFNCYFNLVRTPSTSYQGWTYGTFSKKPWYGEKRTRDGRYRRRLEERIKQQEEKKKQEQEKFFDWKDEDFDNNDII